MIFGRIFDKDEGYSDLTTSVIVNVGGDLSWQNAPRHLDVDNDRFISPLDVLSIINELNAPKSHRFDDSRLVTRISNDLPFLDVNGDGMVDPLDVLTIINRLNSNRLDGEGESLRSEIQDELFSDVDWLDEWMLD